MAREKPVDQRCQCQCGCDQKIDGQGAWQYCSRCRPVAQAAQREVKRKRDRKRRARLRRDDRKRKGDNFYHFLFYHELTEPQLKKCVPKPPSLRDLWPTARDDQHDLALSRLQDLRGRFLYDPHPLPEIIDHTRSELQELIYQFDNRQPNDFIATQLRAHCLEFNCSIGQQLSSRRSFAPLLKRIVTAQEAWRDQGNLINLIMALCIHADFCRARYFYDSYNPKHLSDATRWLDTAFSVLGCCSNPSELDVLRVRHYCVQGKFRIKFDRGATADELEDEIELLRKLSVDIDTAKISYLTACYESEWAIYAGEIAQASEYLTRVDELLPLIGINPFNLREYTVRLKTILAHNQERFDERDAYFHEYVSLFEQEPTIHGYHGLEELRQLCGHLSEPFKTRPRLYVNLMFTGIQEDLIRF